MAWRYKAQSLPWRNSQSCGDDKQIHRKLLLWLISALLNNNNKKYQVLQEYLGGIANPEWGTSFFLLFISLLAILQIVVRVIFFKM